MRILFLTQIVPYPPDAGPKVKTWHVLRYLVEQGHQVTLATFYRDEEVPSLATLERLCERVIAIPIPRSRLADVGYWLKSHLTRTPFIIERDNINVMHAAVREVVARGQIDVIHADQLTMAQFALPPKASDFNPGKWPATIFDAHNAVWTIVQRSVETANLVLKPVLKLEAARIRSYEHQLVTEFDHTLAVSEIDASALIQGRAPGLMDKEIRSKITVIPIAVDTKQQQPLRRKTGSRNIVTLGTLHYPPNADGIRWFANEVFPLVRQEIPEVSLTIIGKNPPADFLKLAKIHPEAVQVTGYVPDLTPYLEDAALMVVPVRVGGGMRVRILEAFAHGIPVVTTTIGLEGIDARMGIDVIVADQPQPMSDAICELIVDRSRLQELAQNGRQLVESKYNWQVVLKELDFVYNGIGAK
jgi:glycosyltransferase involved in cell wall biosynthesis